MEKDSVFASAQFHRGKSVPHWYEIRPLYGNDKNCIGLSLEVAPEVHSFLYEHFNYANRWLTTYRQEWNLPEILSPNNAKWGYGKIIKNVPSTLDKWNAYHIKFPKAPKKNIHSYEQKLIYWKKISIISHTLSQILKFINFFGDPKYTSTSIQLLTIEHLMLAGEMSGAGFNVVLSPLMRFWISNQGVTTWQKVQKTMSEAFERINISYKPSLFNFQCYSEEDRLFMSVPGNCACLGVSGEQAGKSANQPTIMTPHNVDNAELQLILLIGISKVLELAFVDIFNDQI